MSLLTRSRQIISEIIGRTTSPFARALFTARKTVDETRVDYAFWSKLRRGKQDGFRLGALFAKRICEVDAEWTLGRGFAVETDNPTADERFSRFLRDNLNTMLTWRKDANAVGDAYIVVNADASLTLVNPDTVEVLVDALDYTRVLGYRITTILDSATIIDEYRANGRTVTIQQAAGNVSTDYPNLIAPLIPVVHLANDKETNEIYGHPIYEALLTLFARYDDVLQKSLDGVEIMGRPIPVAEGLEDPETARRQNSTRTEMVLNADGTSARVPVVDFEDLTMLWLGQGATFKFASPGSFSADSTAMLKKLFYLMLEHTGIPEWAWGGAVASSKASVDAQMPAFIRYLEGRRAQVQQALITLLDVWYATARLTEPLPDVAEKVIVWPELETNDETLQLEKIKQAQLTNLVTDETALRLLDLVEDAAAEVEAAGKEADERRQQQQDMFDAEITRQQAQLDAEGNQDNGSQLEAA